MLYLLYGKEYLLINEYIEKIKSENNIDVYDIQQFDLENDRIKDIIDAANTFSLFTEKKLIIVDNSYIFTGSRKKVEDEDLTILNKYFENQNPNTILIFKINSETIDSRKKIVSTLKKFGKCEEFNTVTNINNKIKELFKPYLIKDKDITYLINRVGNNIDLISKEIEKIKIYKDNDLNITEDDIRLLTTKNINTDIFNLIDNILNNNKEVVLESYYEMLKRGEEPIKIIIMLANQYRLILQVKQLLKKGYREHDLIDILEQKPYTIKKACERINKYEKDELLLYLKELSDLDIAIKSGKIDKNIGLELFLLNIKKEH